MLTLHGGKWNGCDEIVYGTSRPMDEQEAGGCILTGK